MSMTFSSQASTTSTSFELTLRPNLTFKPTKWEFAVRMVEYLGHILFKHMVQLEPSKTDAVSLFSAPKNNKKKKTG